MRLNLNQLYVFYLVAQNKSMLITAEALFISPPAVSRQIKTLEEWLGFDLFIRRGTQLVITRSGQKLFFALHDIFKNVPATESHIAELMHTEKNLIRLGTHHLPGNYFIPDLLMYSKRQNPDLNLEMELGPQDDMLEKLLLRELDFVLMIGKPPTEAKCKSLHLFATDLALVVSSKGELAHLDNIAIEELSEIPLIIQQKRTGARRVVLDYFMHYGITPNIVLDNLSSDVVKQFLPKMRAASFINRFIVQSELDSNIFHEITIEGPSPICHFYLAYRDAKNLPQRSQLFLASLEGFAPRFTKKVSPGQ